LPQNPPSADFLEKYGPPKNFSPGPYGAHVFRGLAPTSVPDPFSLTSPLGIRIGQPAAGGVANAHGLATVFQWAVGYGSNKPAINPETLADFAQLQVNGYDLVLDAPQVSFGTIFMKPTGPKPFGSPLAFGHDGAAGAMIYADPLGEIVLGYTVQRFTFPGGMDQRLRPIIQAIQSIAQKTGLHQ
jgi:CubicO group peptidase (beta-lactamase class C family)